MGKRDPRNILFLDIETAPLLGYVWGLWKNNVGLNQIYRDSYVLNWAASWLGEDEVIYDSLHYHKLWEKDPRDDSEVLASIWELLDEANYVVAHNGDRFDIPVLNARFLAQGLQPPSTFQTVDTCKIARRKFRFTSNKLDYLAQKLGIGGKVDTGGFELWREVVEEHSRKSFDLMVDYCNHDVELLEGVYHALAPWDEKHPGSVLRTAEDGVTRCPVCSSTRIARNGTYATNTQIYQKWKCSSCGHNMRSRYADRLDRDTREAILRSI